MIVTMLIKAFCAVSDNLATTPDSLNKFPNISIPSSGATEGNNNEQNTTTTIGKIIFSTLETFLNCPILIFLSFSVVNNLIIGG